MTPIENSTPLGRGRIASLLPHSGRMCLLDSIERWDERSIVASATSHRDPDNPLRLDGRLDAIHAAEYASQAIAIHGTLRAGEASEPRMGFLGKLSSVTLERERLDDVEGPLQIHATLAAESHDACMYEFEVRARDRSLVRGKLLIAFAT